jgi:hypothetical protein|tara:strand:- start:367 stop:639 length:273 start_codon:yes stop_codon:yes gene_type:complete
MAHLKGIIFEQGQQAQADELKVSLTNLVSYLFTGVTNEYTNSIVNPSTEKIAVIVKNNSIYWNDVFNYITENELIVSELDNSWKPEEPIH